MTTNVQQWIPALAGQKIANYRLDSKPLGAGGFGVVFSATDDTDGSISAIKILVPGSSTENQSDFDNEGILLQKLAGSLNIVQLTGKSDMFDMPISTPGANGFQVPITMPVKFHVLEIANGGLDRYLAGRDLTWVEILSLWRDIVCGAHQMHLKRVAHRDLKSSNCLMFKKPKFREIVKLTDLGRSRDLNEPARHRPNAYVMGLGDLSYAPPEFIFLQGQDTERAHRDADLYGLGSILIEIVTGVSLTRQIFPDINSAINDAINNSRMGVGVVLSSLRPTVVSTILAMEEDVPRIIRQRIVNLLLTLCDPEPEKRRKVEGVTNKLQKNSLEAIIRQIDIAVRQLTVEERSMRKLAAKRGA
ncbi:hypothetical protein CBI33_22550 [Rhodococcus erythropolis]|nr:hypothetical protein CBI33_22550 [Rhodococcus erythropolis]